MTTAADTLRQAMNAVYLDPGTLPIADGATHRFYVSGDRRATRNGWYCFHGDHPANASFGTYKQPGVIHRWKAENAPCSFVPYPKAVKVSRPVNFCAIWEVAPPARQSHPYLDTKGVPSFGLRFHQGALLVPLMDIEGRVYGIQRIWPGGTKRFIPGSLKLGHFYLVGPTAPTDIVYIAEGYATCATIHMATGKMVAVAFDAGNLKPVAQMLREAFPASRLIICADDDATVEKNPGLTNAMDAARTVGGFLVVPSFSGKREKEDTDFNDLARKEGLGVVRLQLGQLGEVLCSE
ncbi:toprim domain-containing protein [Geomonas agri]|uniref:toprim domain-containing protein n=1 Tax=Geomonas agri TaxID=2873702 RepID=UPI001CD2E28A|nr:toprim domain-containing protein [Geomonas agri]